MQTLFEYSPDIILVIDRHGYILFNNRNLPSHNLSSENLEGQRFAELLPQTHQYRYSQALAKVLASRQMESFQYSMQDSTWWELRLAPSKSIDHVILIIRDITQQRQLQSKAMKHSRFATMGVLAASVAHEINNPNNAIHFNANILHNICQDVLPILQEYYDVHGDYSCGGMNFSDVNQKLLDLCQQIVANSDRIKQIIYQLKRLARKEPESLQESINVAEVVSDSIAILHHQINKYTKHFIVHIAENLPLIKGHAQQLEQVFINVILNALQSLDNREKTVTVTVAFEGNEIVVRVVDQGAGIAPEHLAKITEPFFTTKFDKEGTGLGLSISANIVLEHRGIMIFDSKLKQGTTVKIAFPIETVGSEASLQLLH